jgi:hypothetical protein
MRGLDPIQASCAGLTRASICYRKDSFEKMDCRVKPAMTDFSTMPPPVFRFAPSPNGYLHLGHAYSALLNYDLARRAGGRLLLRIEDIDAARCKPKFEAIFIAMRSTSLRRRACSIPASKAAPR